MRKYFLILAVFIGWQINSGAQDVGISGGFFASVINVTDESELNVTFTNNSFDTSIPPFGAYVQVDFPTTGEYSAPTEPPTGPGSDLFDWTLNNGNIWIGVVNTTIAPLSSHLIIFTVVGEAPTENTPTILYTDLSSGSDNDAQNNNAQPLLQIQQSLPVEFVDFNVERKNCQFVELSWSTAAETNNEGFEIEFSSDAINFEKIGFVKGNGNSHKLTEYNYLHSLHNADSDLNLYYRLKQKDFDGRTSYSKIAFAKNDCDLVEAPIKFGPNPSQGTLNFYTNKSSTNDWKISILDSHHRLVKKISASGESEGFQVDLSNLAKGFYLVKIESQGYESLEKLILTD